MNRKKENNKKGGNRVNVVVVAQAVKESRSETKWWPDHVGDPGHSQGGNLIGRATDKATFLLFIIYAISTEKSKRAMWLSPDLDVNVQCLVSVGVCNNVILPERRRPLPSKIG